MRDASSTITLYYQFPYSGINTRSARSVLMNL